jgi:predicted hotdog family 3-hydroxylacyl-ACP dehydratase
MDDFPPIAELLPQSGNMILLSAVLEHEGDRTVCAAEIEGLGLFQLEDGDVAAWVGIELMAQCIAAHAGLVARLRREQPRIGFLLGSRRVSFHVARYGRSQRLQIGATRIWGRATGMVAFDCSIEDEAGRTLVEGRLNCFLPEDVEVPAV